MFLPRLISGIVMVILLIILIGFGGDVLLYATMAISLIGMFELYRVLKLEKTPLAFVGYLVNILYFINLRYGFITDPFVLVMGLLVILMFVYVFSYPKYEAKEIMGAFFGVFYVGVMLSYIYRLRSLENGLYLTALIFICSWGCDTCAYCVGKLCGKHKMSPVLSPKKSIEGAIGGVLGTALLTVLYIFAIRGQMGAETSGVVTFAIISGVAALISMVGDLCASAIKRNYGIKDYGTLIPGHGGIMDRFDSVMITAPILYYLAVYFVKGV